MADLASPYQVPAISADGRYALFMSNATNLVSGDTNGDCDFFVKDIQTGVTTRVSTSSSGAQGNGPCDDWPSISADGRYAVFASYASNLVSGDTNGCCNVFVKDLQTGQTSLVSTDSSGGEANGLSQLDSVSADGRFVLFNSYATNLVAGDTNGCNDIFLKDRLTGQTTRLTTAADGTQGDSLSGTVSISPDGRFAAFEACSDNLLGEGNDTNRHWDIFVKDLKTGRIVLASTDSTGSTDHTSTTYDRLGRTVTTTDQRGVVHTYSYDTAGRLSADTATDLGETEGVDGSILRIGTTYDSLGRVQAVTSYGDLDGTTVVNQVEYAYDGWGDLIQECQAHDGEVDRKPL